MKIEVYDEDLVSPDFIGEAAYNLTKVKSMPGQPQNEWIQVMKKGKNAGRVRLILTYNGQNVRILGL
jgi:delta-aminolevulinic acid dehydratase/porphobilinogen synthase